MCGPWRMGCSPGIPEPARYDSWFNCIDPMIVYFKYFVSIGTKINSDRSKGGGNRLSRTVIIISTYITEDLIALLLCRLTDWELAETVVKTRGDIKKRVHNIWYLADWQIETRTLYVYRGMLWSCDDWVHLLFWSRRIRCTREWDRW